MKKISFLLLLSFTYTLLTAQTSLQEITENPEKSGGVLYAYPFEKEVYTAPPKGYQPFYISHYSRHGSRYLTDDEEYKWPYELFKDAEKHNALTPLGKDVLKRLELVWEEAQGRGGDLSPLGVKQLRGVAERMYQSFPQVFENNVTMSARSTLVVRCVLSMDAFCERLKELNPKLDITRESSNRYMPYLNPHSAEAIAFRSAKDTWREEYRKFRESHTNPGRFINSLFADETYILQKVNPGALMQAMFQIAGDMQNMEADISFYDIFKPEELFDIWQCYNYHNYVSDGPSAKNGGLMVKNSKPLLQNIIDSANEIINSNKKGATFRFGHDGNLIPLTGLMHLENCYESISEAADFYKVWSNFKVAPMAANIQIIFFRKQGSEDILVKFLHNEKEVLIPPVKSDIAPYYHWKDIEAFYLSLING